jgi:hypothetical protein
MAMAKTGPNEGGPPLDLPDEWALDEETAYGDFREGFQRSRKGNLWRAWRGLTVTVFERRDAFHWCISDGGGPRRSPWPGWADEEGAVRAAWDELEGG